MAAIEPVPQTPIRDNPEQDSIWKRWLHSVRTMLASTTGSGAVVRANTPTLVTPVLGAATGTSIIVSGTIQSTTANKFLSSDSSPGITTTITTGSLVGKTITVKDGLITGFS